MVKRGAFIVFEGLDRSGKSTQVARLVESLNQSGEKAVGCRFPDRTTTTGKMIDSYLAQKSELDDHAIHLLFSANRWERSQAILADLEAGTTVVCDRYAFSGIAFSAVKGLSYTWCQSPDIGLPLPDLVLFLELAPAAAALRGGFGNERYETSEVQIAVKDMFERIGSDVGSERWKVLDAGRDVDAVEKDVRGRVEELLKKVEGPVGKLWA
ncbi:thymidylate kinase-domain-containing protein [Leucosporidium creatinivorum]|uniref:Thymidylate kinase n=1 Tax=Leucosporidium creatinivorum TaxID=106004 RepID=A0A1Y2C173_9BASI|nr:thymidylate kinase-domain-containing protein [Leucosporidium creatinivorum]